ncbi:transposase family protein [Burkholderia pseudomallei]|uniref:transposase n=1 Tax=Burkholderia pseudomallei TaxID=28450 RepID=UPI00050EAD03|nr:transposase family protein [Burkholderia pseudomallei]
MKKSRFSEEQTIGALKEADAGTKTADLCRKHGIADAMFYPLRRHGRAGSAPIAAIGSGKSAPQAADCGPSARCPSSERRSREKTSSPARRRQGVRRVIESRGNSERQACMLVGPDRRTFRQPVPHESTTKFGDGCANWRGNGHSLARLACMSCCAFAPAPLNLPTPPPSPQLRSVCSEMPNTQATTATP